MASPSPKYLLAEERLGRSLAAFLRERKSDGDSLERIARKVWSETGVEVTAMTVSNWLSASEPTEASA